LALAIPAVQVVAASALFRSGVILNSGDAIERLAEVDIVIFDKTGTLTLPEPRIEEAAPIGASILERAARLALSSHHPLAAALAHEARDRVPYPDAREEPGLGVRVAIDGAEACLGSREFCGIAAREAQRGGADGFSEIAFAHAGGQAIFAFRQKNRPEAAAVVAALRRRGLDVHVLSGDRASAVAPVAAALRVQSWTAELKPAGKIAAIESLKQQGRRILMVGDGLNDAPSLAAAHVSMSPISAADITQAQADAVFLGERLSPVLEAIESARGAKRLMKQNLWLAVIYNTIAVPVAIAGFVTPLIAAAAMSGSSLMVTLNALRANRRAARAREGGRS
jgi:Cu2+-exporting ATPase